MALSTMEKVALSKPVIAGERSMWDVWLDLSLSEEEAREVIMWAGYEVSRTWWSKANLRAQRRAYRLLRSMLSPEQNRQLRQGWCKSFKVTGSSGGRFRIYPETGQVWRIESHGQREISVASYCLHTPKRDIPPADEALALMLLIRANEVEFMLRANETIRPPLSWQRAVEHGRSSWNPSWHTKDKIEQALADMLEHRREVREAAEWGRLFAAA